MEYIEGETLAARLEKGALPLDQSLSIGIEVADALDKARRAGIIHRDLKPGNIMLTQVRREAFGFFGRQRKPCRSHPARRFADPRHSYNSRDPKAGMIVGARSHRRVASVPSSAFRRELHFFVMEPPPSFRDTPSRVIPSVRINHASGRLANWQIAKPLPTSVWPRRQTLRRIQSPRFRYSFACHHQRQLHLQFLRRAARQSSDWGKTEENVSQAHRQQSQLHRTQSTSARTCNRARVHSCRNAERSRALAPASFGNFDQINLV